MAKQTTNTRTSKRKTKTNPKGAGAPRGNKNAVGNKGGGRTSISDNQEFVETLYKISTRVLKPKHMYMFTDRLIIGLINENLKTSGIILKTSTFATWKKLWVEDRTQDFFNKRPFLIEFFELYENLMRRAEEYLLTKLQAAAPGHWQKFAWILERRFQTWQMDSAKNAAPIIQVLQLNIEAPQDVPLITSERQMIERENEFDDYEEVD